MSSYGVEIPKKCAAPLWVGCTHIFDDLFHEVFRLSIGVCAISGWVFFIYRKVLWLSINGGTGAEDNLLHTELHHDLHEVCTSSDIVSIILQWKRARFSNGFQSSEMDDAVDFLSTCMGFCKHLSQGILICDVGFIESYSLSRQLLNPQD